MFCKTLIYTDELACLKPMEEELAFIYKALTFSQPCSTILLDKKNVIPPPERLNYPGYNCIYKFHKFSKTVVYLYEFGDTILMPAMNDFLIYTDRASICPLILSNLEDQFGNPLLLLAHIHGASKHDTIDQQVQNVIKNITGRNLKPKQIIFSPSQDSDYKSSGEELSKLTANYIFFERPRSSGAYGFIDQNGFCFYDRPNKYLFSSLWNQEEISKKDFFIKI